MSGQTLMIILAGVLIYPLVLSTLHFIIFCDFALKVQKFMAQFDQPEDPSA